jgi:hypothetical protein
MTTYTVSAGQSIQTKINSAVAGDIIQIETDDFSEAITVNKALTVKNATGHTPVIRGVAGANYIIKITASGVTLDGLHVNLDPTYGSRGVQTWDFITVSAPNAELKNLYIYQSDVATVADAENEYIHGRRYKGIGLSGSGNNAKIIDCEITGVCKGVHVGAVKNAYITGCDIHLTQQSCIVFANTAAVNAGNLVFDNDLHDSAIEDGVQWVQDFNAPNPGTVTNNMGTIVRGNRIYGNRENACDLKGARNVVIENNLIWGTFGSNNGELNGWNRSAFTAISKGANADAYHVIIRGNVLMDNSNGIMAHNDYKIYHNVIVNNRHDYTGSNSSYSTSAFHGVYQREANLGGTLVIKNNIIGGHTYAQIRLRISGTNFDIDGNLYFAGAGQNRFVNTSGSSDNVYTFSAWQTYLNGLSNVAGKEANSQYYSGQSSVEFTDVDTTPVGAATAQDFSLLGTSPGAMAAVPITTVTSISGNAITVGDGGCFCDGYGSTNTDGDTIYLANGKITKIQSITGNVLTVSPAVTAPGGTGVYWSGLSGRNVGLVASLTGTPPTGDPPVAAFDATPKTATGYTKIAFTNQSVVTGVATYSWKYTTNGGSSWTEFSTAESPQQWLAPGDYGIRLTVTDTIDTTTLTRLTG